MADDEEILDWRLGEAFDVCPVFGEFPEIVLYSIRALDSVDNQGRHRVTYYQCQKDIVRI